MVWISIVDPMNHDLWKPILDKTPLSKAYQSLGYYPRQNFSLCISQNATLRPLINSRYTPTYADYGFHDWFAKHLFKAWFHMDHYRQPTPFLQLHTIHTTKKCVGIHLDHIVLYLSPKVTISNISAQLLAHFLGNPLQSSPVTKLIRSSAYHPRTDGQTEKWTES